MSAVNPHCTAFCSVRLEINIMLHRVAHVTSTFQHTSSCLLLGRRLETCFELDAAWLLLNRTNIASSAAVAAAQKAYALLARGNLWLSPPLLRVLSSSAASRTASRSRGALRLRGVCSKPSRLLAPPASSAGAASPSWCDRTRSRTPLLAGVAASLFAAPRPLACVAQPGLRQEPRRGGTWLSEAELAGCRSHQTAPHGNSSNVTLHTELR